MSDQLKKGNWVLHNGKIAILNDVQGLAGEVHYVNTKNGTTELIIKCPLNELTKAKFMDIPKCRRPSKAVGKARGYL